MLEKLICKEYPAWCTITIISTHKRNQSLTQKKKKFPEDSELQSAQPRKVACKDFWRLTLSKCPSIKKTGQFANGLQLVDSLVNQDQCDILASSVKMRWKFTDTNRTELIKSNYFTGESRSKNSSRSYMRITTVSQTEWRHSQCGSRRVRSWGRAWIAHHMRESIKSCREALASPDLSRGVMFKVAIVPYVRNVYPHSSLNRTNRQSMLSVKLTLSFRERTQLRITVKYWIDEPETSKCFRELRGSLEEEISDPWTELRPPDTIPKAETRAPKACSCRSDTNRGGANRNKDKNSRALLSQFPQYGEQKLPRGRAISYIPRSSSSSQGPRHSLFNSLLAWRAVQKTQISFSSRRKETLNKR